MEKWNTKEAVQNITKVTLAALAITAPEKTEAGAAVYTQLESVSGIESGSEAFSKDVSSRVQEITMPNGVLYVGADGAPLAMVPAQMLGEQNPGKGFTEEGRVTEGYDSRWMEEAKKVAARFQPEVMADGVTARYNWKEVQNAISNPDEHMTAENVDSIQDIVFYFGDKETRDGDGLSRIEYVQEHVVLDEKIPEALQKELVKLVVGIAAQESRYNDAVKSPVGASGIFQLMPQTVDGLGEYSEYVIYKKETVTDDEGTEKEIAVPVGLNSIPLTVQVEMAGEHISNIYNELRAHVDEQVFTDVRQLYTSDEDFFAYFMAPVIINAYNTGGGRMAALIKTFMTPEKQASLQEVYGERAGYDIFEQMTDFGHASDEGLLNEYRRDSATYFEGVLAFYLMIQRDYEAHKEYEEENKNYIVAQN